MTNGKPITFLYDGEKITRCVGYRGTEGCGAEIFWIETRNGKRMPVNWSKNPDERISHFATCPHASEFRSKRKRFIIIKKEK